MNKKQLSSISIILTILSGLVSCTFAVYGAGLVFGQEVPAWIIAFGVVTFAYGLCSFIVLILAWRRYGGQARKIIAYLAAIFIILFFLGSLDVGMVSGLEVTGILLVGIMLFVNWLAVSTVVKLKNVA